MFREIAQADKRVRRCKAAFGAAFMLTALAAPCSAQQFPSKPITLVVPYAPGGNVDISTRILQAGIGNSLGQPIIIENRPGAGGTIAGDYVARSAPDGHTLFVGSNGPIMFGPMTMPKPPYQWDKVFAPVSTLAFATNMLLVRQTLPVKNRGRAGRILQEKSRQAHPRHVRRRQHQPFPGASF